MRPTAWWRLRRVWWTNIRPVWHAVRPVALITLALAVLVLGTIGFLNTPDGQTYSVSDAFYRALLLFGFGGAVTPPVPWQLEIARILGPLVVGYAALGGLIALSRRQLQLLGMRFMLRDHVVVAGLGDTGFRVAVAFHEQGFRVVVIERDTATSAIQGCRERGIDILNGDARDASLLSIAAVARARYLVVTSGDDVANMDIAIGARGLTAKRRASGALTALVELEDIDFWRVMKAEALNAPPGSRFRLEIFNSFAIGARMMLSQYQPFERGDEQSLRRPHVLILGFDGVAYNLALHIARLWMYETRRPGEGLRITIGGPGAEANRTRLLARFPEIESIIESIDARDFEVDSLDIQRRAMATGATCAYICLADESDALAAALVLHRRPDFRHVPIAVAVADHGAGVSSVLSAGGDYENVNAFGVLSQSLTPEVLLRGTTEMLARAAHDVYLQTQHANGAVSSENSSQQPWEDLPESFKESNRRFAGSIGSKLAAVGCVAVPAPLIDPGRTRFAFSNEEVEKLGEMEHQRWADDLKLDGWRQTDGPKDSARKLHPLIDVKWEMLPDVEREKDRVQVKALPAVLAQAGFEIYRVESVPEAKAAPGETTSREAVSYLTL